MIQDRDITDMIVDPEMTDSILLEGEESQTGVINCKHNQELNILLNAMDISVKVTTIIRRHWRISRNSLTRN